MNVLVGYTGFVGSNIYAKGNIDKGFNSQNIEESYGSHPDLLIYAGLRAEKYLANSMPDKDMEQVRQAEENIKKIAPRQLVLISTVDVFRIPVEVNEKSKIDYKDLHAYGRNRFFLECWVRKNYPSAIIIRLPALFGINIKKNFIFDYINVIPAMLKQDKFEELSEANHKLKEFYDLQGNGYYRCKTLVQEEKDFLKDAFRQLRYTALNFTDSRSVFQFYPLERLWNDIEILLKKDIRLWHPATEPISAGELYRFLTGSAFINELDGVPAYYNYKTLYEDDFHGNNGYICTKQQIMRSIANFVSSYKL